MSKTLLEILIMVVGAILYLLPTPTAPATIPPGGPVMSKLSFIAGGAALVALLAFLLGYR